MLHNIICGTIMTQTLTIALISLTILITVMAIIMARRPRELGKSWHIPWNGVIFLGLLSLLLLIRHQLSLSGIDLPPR